MVLPAADTGSHIFVPQPEAGSGLRIAAHQGWAPGNAPAIARAVGIPPGSGATLSERDRRLAARHEERRRRNSYGPQEGPANKRFQEREQERQAFDREAEASKRSVDAGQRGLPSNEVGHPPESRSPSTFREKNPVIGGGGRRLTSALDQKLTEKNAREAKYEEKRRRYLAASSGSTPSDPRVRFQVDQTQDAPAVPRHSPALVSATILGEEEHILSQPPSVKRASLLKAPSPGAENQATEDTNEPIERRNQGRFQQQDEMLAPSSARLGLPEQDLSHRQQNSIPAVTKYPYADYAKQLREQMTADAAAAQRAKENDRRPAPAAASITSADQSQSIRHAQPAVKGGNDAMIPSATNRKAEYARQLREQMAADEAMRHALETERKSRAASASTTVVPTSGGQEEGSRGRDKKQMDGSLNNAKAEYAQQLREQIAAKESAQRATRGKMENSPSTGAGPSWIEGATEGREARRKRSNTEYAEQLRAQIAAQKGINQAQQNRIAAQMEPPNVYFRQAGQEKEYHQQQRQWLRKAGSIQGPAKEPQWHRLRSSTQDEVPDSEVERSQTRGRGEERPLPSRAQTSNSLALERQKRADHQREYAEALRRDMAAPKVDSLGRPMEDITSPSKTRLRNKNNDESNFGNDGSSDRDGGGSAPHESRHLQLGPRRQAGGDMRGQGHQQQQPHGPRSSSQAHGRGWYEGGEQQYNRRPSVPETHYDAYGRNPYEYQAGGGYDEPKHTIERRTDARWDVDERAVSERPPPQRGDVSDGERRRGDWGTRNSYTEGGGYPGNTGRMPDHGDGVWQGYGSSSSTYPGQMWENRGQQEYRYSGLGGPPGGAPAAGVGVGIVSTKASAMHNPVGPAELARIQAKKDSYRRDLEAQIAEHKNVLDQRKKGAPGSKEAEVFHLQEAMEERNKRNKLAPGYEIGPLGVAVIKDNYSSTGRGKRSPSKIPPAAPATAGIRRPAGSSAVELLSRHAVEPASSANSGLPGGGHREASPSLLPPPEGGAGVGDAEGFRAPSRRGSGLRDLLGTEMNAESGREKSRVQAEALKKQVEDNKARRNMERAQLESDEIKEELKLQKEREQLHERYEQEGKLAKALESEKLLKEAEEARLAHAARKEKAAAESREEEIREDARVEREQKELESKYARERAVEEPLGQASSTPAKPRAPELPVKRVAAVHSPTPSKAPYEVEAPLIKPQSNDGDRTVVAVAAPTNIQTEALVRRGPLSPHQPASPREIANPREGVSIEKLRTELWKQKQLTEVLRHAVGQQEVEKNKLLHIAKCAKESEAAALRAAYERQASQHMPAREIGNARSAAAGNELWRVPPPPAMESKKGEGRTSRTSALRLAKDTGAAKNDNHSEHGAERRSEMDETAEDRLLLAGLRKLDNLGGNSTFRERVPGARAWSSGAATNSGDGRSNKGLALDYDAVSPGGIRAESRYVFPDGSVRPGLETPGAIGRMCTGGDSGVAMPLVGTSRMASPNLSLALGINALRGGGDGGGGDGIKEVSGRERGVGKNGRREDNGGAYRGPGAAPGAGWAPGGRPPRAFVPFLNLPASNGKVNGKANKGQRWTRRSGNGRSDGGDSPSFLPRVYSGAGKGSSKRRRRPLAGVGGVPVSPGRAMLTGPGRPGTGGSPASWMMSGETDSEHGHTRPSRRRVGRDRSNNPPGDREFSDGSDSVGSGSTDVEFLRRRAEAKLRSLDRQEAADQAKEEELDLLVASSSARRTARVAHAEAPAAPSPTARGVVTATSIRSNVRGTFSAASSSSSRSLMYPGRKKRPGTNKSESSILGDSRWATLQGTNLD